MNDEFADEVHEFVETGHVDTDRLLCRLQAVARDCHTLGGRKAAGLGAQVGLAALAGRRLDRVQVVGAVRAEGRGRKGAAPPLGRSDRRSGTYGRPHQRS